MSIIMKLGTEVFEEKREQASDSFWRGEEWRKATKCVIRCLNCIFKDAKVNDSLQDSF
jgi:hypothetical protein